MAERITIVVAPPPSELQGLEIEDAMRQVLDAFQLLISSFPADDSITWHLVEARTNSPPFSVVAEARSTRPGVDVDLIAKSQKRNFSKNMRQLTTQGELPSQWRSERLKNIAGDFVRRNRNGVAITRIQVEPTDVINVTPTEAEHAAVAFAAPPKIDVPPRTVYGSIEGVILQVRTHYEKPAVRLKERVTGEWVWCLIDERASQQIAKEANFDDVWKGRRVRVKGKLAYGTAGKLEHVYAEHIEPIAGTKVDIEQIRDKEFTAGLSPSQYIDRLREGELD